MEKSDTKINSYLSFKIGNEEFAVHVNSILNILEMVQITEVPRSPDYMKGVINLRGTVLPIIDIRLRFGLTQTVYTDKTCIVVMEVNIDNQKILVGSLVDEVISVLEFSNDDILPAPSIGSNYESEFIEGMVKIDDKLIMILDINKIYTVNDMSILKEKTANTITVNE